MSKSSSSAITLEEFCSKVDKEKYLKQGKELVNRNVGKSFSLLSFGLSLSCNKREEYLELYLKVVELWSKKLTESSRYQDCLKIFEVAQDIYPHSPDLEYLLACTLYRIGKYRESWQYSLKALKRCRNDPKVRNLVSALSSLLVDRWHFPMINDRSRNEKFQQAITSWVFRNNGSVLDIGTGSGLFSIYSKLAGSSITYACEADEFMAEIAASVLSLNGAEKDVVLINKHSKDLKIPSDISSRVSLVVTETFDAGLFGEHVLHTLNNAWEQLLQPPLSDPEAENSLISPRVLPAHAEVYIAVVECDFVARQIKLIRQEDIFRGATVFLQLKEPYLSEKIYNVPGQFKLLTKWKKVLDVNFNSPSEVKELINNEKNEEFQIIVEEEGRGDGIILAYKLFLDSEHFIATFPESETCWENAIYPIFSLSPFVKGNLINIKMECDGTLHFRVIEHCNDPGAIPANMQFLKCANSSSYAIFYKRTAENIAQSSCTSLTVLDGCPFPKGGLTLLELKPKTSLYLSSESAYMVFRELIPRVNFAEELRGKVDVIFYWPFTSEGTLKDELLDELNSYRKLLTRRGKIYPEYLDLQILGLDSDIISKMTRVKDENTLGVKVAEVLNILKTIHHLDVAIEGLSYYPLTPVFSPMRLNLNTSEVFHRGQMVSEDFPPEGFLLVGGNLSRSSFVFRTLGGGSLEGFVYWFELENASVDQDISSGSDVEFFGKSTGAVVKKNTTREYGPWEEPRFSSICRDSPISQCVLLLDGPLNLLLDQQCRLIFSMKEEYFSVSLEHV